MKQWRVGTVSMGVSMICLGVVLFLTQVKGVELLNSLLSWWPIIVILLGLEILLYSIFARKENLAIKYDVVSILLVGFLGTVCIGMTLLTSFGLVAEVRHALSAVERTYPLPSFSQQLPPEVERIVVQAQGLPITLDSGDDRQVRIFGSYRTTTIGDGESAEWQAADFSSIETVGHTMYVTLHQLPEKHGLYSYSPRTEITLVLPQQVPVEVRGDDHDIQLNLSALSSNWTVKNAAHVAISLPKSGDLKLLTVTEQPPQQTDAKWRTMGRTESPLSDGQEGESMEKMYKGELILGEGTHELRVVNSFEVTVNTL
ncbi:hypothetical protein LOK74_13895 [Brevibacillus humidisoli]|uniref:LiaF transmembrane domain-containing protein n=1 Tax=Brevibacillus humidisoli TaxID=2895522 RepID=UPI001E4295C3|nr:hypothetical protein [Brevibacillus humidisoli]UFJ39161.1 hypothetical protein LOK74_13895 [Brevibacillus humidisoli]